MFTTMQLVLAASMALVAPQTRTPETPDPAVAPRAATGFHPDLEAAIAELAIEEVRWNRLALRWGDGDHDALQKLYEEALEQLPRDVVREFDADHGISTRTIYEMLAGWKADGVFRRLLERSARNQRPLALDDLLAVLRSPDLAKFPRERAPRAVRDYVDEVVARTSPDFTVNLWYPSVAWLCFAALNASPSWWPDGESGRALRSAFITTLLELVVDADDPRLMTSIVDVALAPPLDLPHARGLVTCCRSEFARHRGHVGFDRSHLEFVSRFGVGAQQPAERVDGVTLAPLMATPPTVAGFMAMMRLRILLDVDSLAVDGAAAMRLGTAAEVEAWYREMFAERGWQNFWAEAGPDVERMVAGTFPDLRDAKVDALTARLADAALSDEERTRVTAELRELEQARGREQEHVAGVILGLLASAGDPALVKDELLRLQPKSPYGDWDTTLVAPWLTLLGRDASWVDELVDDHVRGRREASKPALECALLDLRRRLQAPADAKDRAQDRAQVVEAVVELGTRGSAAVRGSAFLDQSLLPSDAARRLYDAALADAAAPPGDPRDDAGRRLFRPMVELLFERRNEPWVHAALLDTFSHDDRGGSGGDAGPRSLWRGDYFYEPPPEGPLAQQQEKRNRELLEWLATEMSDDEFQTLARDGRIPQKILDARAKR